MNRPGEVEGNWSWRLEARAAHRRARRPFARLRRARQAHRRVPVVTGPSPPVRLLVAHVTAARTQDRRRTAATNDSTEGERHETTHPLDAAGARRCGDPDDDRPRGRRQRRVHQCRGEHQGGRLRAVVGALAGASADDRRAGLDEARESARPDRSRLRLRSTTHRAWTTPALPQMVPATTPAVEAKKTEPDKNTYLVLKGQRGADPGYDYGTHFLYQGHEVGAKIPGSTLRQSLITRINLDADSAHRVTLLASAGLDRRSRSRGSTARRGTRGPSGCSSRPRTAPHRPIRRRSTCRRRSIDISGALGRGGYEGIQNDSAGNIWIVEDIGGPNKPGTTAKKPNSFLYRYIPRHPGDLENGKLRGAPGHECGPSGDRRVARRPCNAPDQVAAPHVQQVLDTKWVTDPRHRHRRGRTVPGEHTREGGARDAVQATRERPVPPRLALRRVLLRRDRRHERNERRERRPTTGAGGAGGWTSIFKLVQQSIRRPTPAGSRSSTRATSRSPGSTTSRSSHATS